MRNETELRLLRRQVARAKALVEQTAKKVEELEASVEEIYLFKERLVMFPRCANGKRPVRVDRTEEVGEFLLT
ncbi:MAG TPA: hypothetical protein VH280_11660 [Verrucomicrobiae bacterium]|jgi:hypothetical protein|nr:hypothetical protein [Verrucomicrobiae bacterium]